MTAPPLPTSPHGEATNRLAAHDDGPAPPPGQALAVAAEALFLLNLMLLPGLAFVALALLWRHQRHSAPTLARQHLDQTFFVSLWGGVLIVLVGGLMLAFGGLGEVWTWVVVILYFTAIHSTLIIGGSIGLARALAGQPWRFPLVGPRGDD